MIFLDTHVAIWLVIGELDRFSRSVLKILETKDPIVSPILFLEIEFLYEIKRLKYGAEKFKDVLAGEFNVQTAHIQSSTLVQASLKENWTRDPFDRTITGHARLNDAVLISGDTNIKKHYSRTLW